MLCSLKVGLLLPCMVVSSCVCVEQCAAFKVALLLMLRHSRRHNLGSQRMVCVFATATFFLAPLQPFTFLFFACCVIVMTILVAALFVETKGTPIEECPLLFREHWLWKR